MKFGICISFQQTDDCIAKCQTNSAVGTLAWVKSVEIQLGLITRLAEGSVSM